MPSVRYPLQLQLLLLLSLLLLTAGQRSVPAPRRDLQTPNFSGESFERFGGGGLSGESQESSEENSAEMREELKQLLGEQLANAFAPLATTAFSPTTQRRPGVIAPSTATEARAQFADDPESNEEDEDGDEESSVEEPTPQPQPQPVEPQQPPVGGAAGEEEQPEEDYNPWRDNFYDLNEDGSYVFG